RRSFQDIATIKLSLSYTDQLCSEEEVLHYWQFFAKHLPKLLPTQSEILHKASKIDGDSIILTVATDAEAMALKRRIEQPFHEFCEHVGLKKYQIQLEVKTAVEDLENFRKQKDAEDKEFGRNAAKLQQ